MKVLSNLPAKAPDWVVVGQTSLDDAAVLRWPSGSVDSPHLISTVDFISPVVDDPFTFGAVAAANALSDVYAMGGVPRFALAIVGFPSDVLPLSALEQILAGGASKVAEAGAWIVGGHTVNDAEPKYGLAVTGEAKPDQLITQAGARAGDALVLTKRLGTGLAIGAMRKDALSAEAHRALTESMLQLNARASQHMIAVGAHAATDVTGFGLLGHAFSMARAAQVCVHIEASTLPALPEAMALAEAASSGGKFGGAAGRNLRYVEESLTSTATDTQLRLSVDAQTSGGLLIAIAEARTAELLARLAGDGIDATRIGGVLAGPAGALRLNA